MRVLVVGSGAREHALAWACAGEGVELFCAPGNGGTASIANNLRVSADDVDNIVGAARERDVDLVVIGPDAAIAAGLADACGAAGIAVFGPTREAGLVESSKEVAKRLMDDAGIPTARWRAGDADDRDTLRRFVDELGGHCVVKADGLALGKGVTVCDEAAQALAAIDECLVARRFGDAGARVVVEELLTGREVSVLALCDGEHIRALVPACDYKRAYDGDLGPNTGGMGALAPPVDLDVDALVADAVSRVIEPCVATLAQRGTPYCGCLYAGLMLTADGLRVLEFNARFGDPEAQVILPLLDEDLLPMLVACARGGLEPGRTGIAGAKCAVGVVAASAGYPAAVTTGAVIEGLDAVADDALLFHAGTRHDEQGVLRTSGGRVLTVVVRGVSLEETRERVYDRLRDIHFDGMWFRRDIALMAAGVPVL